VLLKLILLAYSYCIVSSQGDAGGVSRHNIEKLAHHGYSK
jgi:hypothetical protein